MLKNLQKNKGFTFVELVISIAILAIVATAIIGIMSSNTVVFRKSKADLDIQNVAMDSFNQLENDIMQAKYIYIEADGKKYTCESDKNLLHVGGKSKIPDLIAMTDADLQNKYKALAAADATGTQRKVFDSYYNKVRYMSAQDKILYYAFLDSGIGDDTNETFESLSKTDVLSNVTLIRVVYPVKDDSPSSEVTNLDDGSVVSEPLNYMACVVDYKFDSGKIEFQRRYSDDYSATFPTDSDPWTTYTDLASGNLSAVIDCAGNSIKLSQGFDKQSRKYQSERTIPIRNSYVLKDQGDVAAAPPSPTPTP